MEGLTGLLPGIEKYKERDGPKVEFEFQSLALEMVAHFGQRHKSQIWGNFYKSEYSVPLIYEAWLAYQRQSKEKSIKSFPYFMGILNRKAGIKK